MTMSQIALTALVDPHGAVLLRKRDEQSAVESNRWGLPGGRVEQGESAAEAARRHVAEQTGLMVPGPLRLVWRGLLPSMPIPVQVHFFAAATTADIEDIVPQHRVVTTFVPGRNILTGRSFTAATGFVLGRFLDALEHDVLTESRIDLDDVA